MSPSHNAPKLPQGDPWYAATLNSIADGVIAADVEGRVTYLNPAAEKITGWTREEALGQQISTVYEVVDEETGQEITRLLKDIALGGKVAKVDVDMLLLAKGGERKAVEDSAAPLRD